MHTRQASSPSHFACYNTVDSWIKLNLFRTLRTYYFGANKHLMKDGKKGTKKKVIDPFSKKDWYDRKAPAMFNTRNIGKTLVTWTQGTQIASDGLRGHVFEVSLADLWNDEVAFTKFKLITEDVQGKNYLTDHGMDLTCDKMCSMIRTWQTMTEVHVDVKTTDGYLPHLFCVGFTKNNWQSESEDLLHSAPTGPPNSEKDDGNPWPKRCRQMTWKK